MFRAAAAPVSARPRFPRVRGDVPDADLLVENHGMFSPRARGCSRHGVADAAVGAVFPACAGMFPHG